MSANTTTNSSLRLGPRLQWTPFVVLPALAATVSYTLIPEASPLIRAAVAFAVGAALPFVRRGPSSSTYVIGVIAILFALVGPASTEAFGAAGRLGSWIAFIGVAGVVVALVRHVARRDALVAGMREGLRRGTLGRHETSALASISAEQQRGRGDIILSMLTPVAGATLVWQLLGPYPPMVRGGIVIAFVAFLVAGLLRRPLWVLYGAGITAALLPLAVPTMFMLPTDAVKDQWVTFAGVLAVVAYLVNRLREQEQVLNELSDLKDRFVALANHELRTPVAVLDSTLDTLMEDLDGTLSDKQRAFLVAAKLNTDRLRQQVEMLTQFNHLRDAEVCDVDVEPVGKIVDAVTSELRPYFAGRGVTLETDVEPRAAWVSFPVDHLTVVIEQLLRNAAAFNSPAGHARLRATVDRSMLVLEVEDDGWGIPPESRDAIFESFYKPGDLMTQPNEGLGLGLALVRLAVRSLDGDVVVESAEGQGSRFSVRLPMRPWISQSWSHTPPATQLPA